MKTASLLPRRVLALGFVLALTSALSPALAVASQTLQPGHRAAQHLAAHGSLPLKTVGPYVHVGTFRIQVSTKLGRPDFALPDGTWLYENYTIPPGDARGTLVVRFENGRVLELALATPAVVAALRERGNAATFVLASKP